MRDATSAAQIHTERPAALCGAFAHVAQSSGVAAVSEDVVASNPTVFGHLDEGPAGGPSRTIVSFLAGDNGYTGYDNGVVSTLSHTGQETIANGSSGTVDVQVGVTGVFTSPSTPPAPGPVVVRVTGTSATVVWNGLAGDGGSPITGYTVSTSPDNTTVTVDPFTATTTLTGLANPVTDTYTVTAANAEGTSSASATPVPPGLAPDIYTPTSAPTGISEVVTEADGVTPMANATVGVFYQPSAGTDGPQGTVINLPEIASGSTNANGVFTAIVDTSAIASADLGDIGDGTNDAFNAYIVATDSTGHTAEYGTVLRLGATTADTASANPSDTVAGQYTSQTPISMSMTVVDSGGTYRYIPVVPLNSGYGEQVSFSYSPSSSVQRQSLVDIAGQFGSGGSWSVHGEHLEEQDRSSTAPFTPSAGRYHGWVWGNYKFREVSVRTCYPNGHCMYHNEWHVHHFQGQLTDTNPDGCKQHHPGFCAPIGFVPYREPRFTPGNPGHNYVVILSAQNTPWQRQTGQYTENSAGGAFYLPFAGGVQLDTTTNYGSITSISYSVFATGNCPAATNVKVVWGYNDDPEDAGRVNADCVTYQQLNG